MDKRNETPVIVNEEVCFEEIVKDKVIHNGYELDRVFNIVAPVASPLEVYSSGFKSSAYRKSLLRKIHFKLFMKRKSFFIILIYIICLLPFNAFALEIPENIKAEESSLELDADAAIVMDATTGEILFENGLKQTEIGYLPQQTDVQRDFPASVWEIVLSGCQSGCGLRPFYSKKEKETVEKFKKHLKC